MMLYVLLGMALGWILGRSAVGPTPSFPQPATTNSVAVRHSKHPTLYGKDACRAVATVQ
jgi:hypothetical protein